MNPSSFLRCSFGLALSISLFAQSKGTPTTPTTPTTPNPGSPTRPNSPNFPGTQPDSTQDQFQRPLFLTGKVVMDDGSPLSDQIVIQLVCRGLPRNVAYTDSKGNFSADLNSRVNNAMYSDASQPFGSFGDDLGSTTRRSNNSPFGGGISERDLMGCDIQAYLPGFRSDVQHLANHRSMDNPDIGTLILHRLANVEGLTISITSAMAPKDAKKSFDKARNEEKKQKWPDAQKELEKAVAAYPKYATAWNELGNVQQQQKDSEGARKSYAEALKADPKFVSPYLQLAMMAAKDQNWQETADDTDRLLRLNPVDFPIAWLYNGIANYYLKKLDVAEKSAREGISHDPNHRFPTMNRLLGVILAQKEDYAGSVEHLRQYLQYAPNATDSDQVKKQLAELEKAIGPEAKKQ